MDIPCFEKRWRKSLISSLISPRTASILVRESALNDSLELPISPLSCMSCVVPASTSPRGGLRFRRRVPVAPARPTAHLGGPCEPPFLNHPGAPTVTGSHGAPIRSGSFVGPAWIGESPRHDVVILILRPLAIKATGSSGRELIFGNEHVRADLRLWPICGLQRTILRVLLVC